MKKMKTKNVFKCVILLLLVFIMKSCIEDNDYSVPKAEIEEPNIRVTNTISSVRAMYNNSVVDFNKVGQNLVIEGYVVSSDESGNIYKTISIQDKPENPTAAVQLAVDATDTYTFYEVGRKVYVKLNNLGMTMNNGILEIGALKGISLERIASTTYKKAIVRSTELATITPLVINSISDITDANVNMLIQLNDMRATVQNQTYANSKNTYSVNREFENCSTKEKISMRNSGFATFKGQSIPNKRGSIVAILGKYRATFQLYIRDTEDVSLNADYDCGITITEKPLSDIKALFEGSEITISEDAKIKVVVTSALSEKNISDKNAFVQDATAGIALHFSDVHDLKLGDEIELAVKEAKLGEYKGLLQLNVSSSDILSKKDGVLPTPETITIEQALTDDFEGKLVKIEGVQFKDITKKYSGENLLTSDCSNELVVYVQDDATFSSDPISNKKGTITGVMSDLDGVQLYLAKVSDVNFTKDYTSCGSAGGTSGTTSDLFFSEYTEGSSNNKYIEIYNGTDADIDLSPYKVELYGNGAATARNTLDLSILTNKVLVKGDVFVIYNSRAIDAIKSEGDVSASVTLFNGDDALVLKKGDVIIDVIGKVGEDPGDGWKVAGEINATKDRTLIRKTSIIKGNTDWVKSAGTDITSSEWIVKDKDDFSSVGKR